MKISIERLTLTNFKCFRSKEITFDSDVTTIKGRNGVGKTTIADAILWCLFGKNSEGKSDFDLKTHDVNGKVIPNLDHSVEMELHIYTPATMVTDGREYDKEQYITITLKRTLKETWIKKRGSEELVFKNNTTEYLINGDDTKAADYKKYIAQLVDEEVFKAITSPTYFPSLKWQVQREFLTKMVDMSDVAPTKEELESALSEIAPNQTLIDYRKHLSYQIKGIKDKLDRIPIRLEEQNKALPEQLDWESLTFELDKAKKELDEVDKKILTIKSGNSDDVKRSEIRDEIKKVQFELDAIEVQVRAFVRSEQSSKDDKVAELSRKFNELLNNQKDIELATQSLEKMKARCDETLEKCEKDAQDIRTEWAHNNSRKFVFHENYKVCPRCGQYLPEDQIEEKRKKAEENLNADKARIKTELTEKAEKVKVLRADAEKQIEDLKTKNEELEKNLAEVKEAINNVFSEKAKAEKVVVKTIEQCLEEDEGYQQLLKKKDELQQKLETSTTSEEDKKTLEELVVRKCVLNEGIDTINRQLATRDQRLKILALIDGINEEQKDLVRQLSELERKEDVARKYQDRQNAILEERINEHFKLVQWKMFRTVNNGGDPFDEPYCECYVDGVAYHDGLNQAARLNAGLDIIRTLCKHYNVSAPIVIDNSESNLDILQTESQQIRLEVFNSDLQIV